MTSEERGKLEELRHDADGMSRLLEYERQWRIQITEQLADMTADRDKWREIVEGWQYADLI